MLVAIGVRIWGCIRGSVVEATVFGIENSPSRTPFIASEGLVDSPSAVQKRTYVVSSAFVGHFNTSMTSRIYSPGGIFCIRTENHPCS